MMTIYIVRHGQTEENLQRILQGHMPGTLTEQGKEQVQRAAEQLSKEGVKFTRIVSSDLKRAMDSAQIIADTLNLPIIPMEIPLLLISCVKAPIKLFPFLLFATFWISSTSNSPMWFNAT